MMSTAKKRKVDFGSMLADSRGILADVKRVNESVTVIQSATLKYRRTDNYARFLQRCESSSAQVVLVCRLGFQGVDALRTAAQYVPTQFNQHRFEIISNIVNKVLEQEGRSKDMVDAQECSFLLQLCNRNCPKYMKRNANLRAYDEETLALSKEKGMGYQAFISPPVSACINPICEGNPLSSYTEPVKVTVFDMDGPHPATKVCMRCPKCATNYNHTMFGNKRQRGERYYDMLRDYIEVSDVIYVSRTIHNLFASLR